MDTSGGREQLSSCQGGQDDPKSCSYCSRLAGRYFTAESGVRDFMGAWVIERGREKMMYLAMKKMSKLNGR